MLNGQQLYITTELNTGVVATSKCANQTALFTVGCFTQPPVITADNNNQITAGAPITGTSTEVSGTTIRVYNIANTLLATTTVQANGTWSTGNVGTIPATYTAVAGTSYYANAQNGTCGVSANTASYAAASITPSGRCGTITGPIAPGAGSISGTLTGSFTTSTVNLYLDDQFIGTTTTGGTAWGPITVNSTINNTLYSNGVLSIGIQETGKQEVPCPASKLAITCTPTPVAPIFTPATSTIYQGQSITYTITNAVAGTFYAIADSATGNPLGQGDWATTNGSLNLTSYTFDNPGTFTVIVKSTTLSSVTVCTAVSLSGSAIVNPIILPVALIRFTGKKQGNDIMLEWATENEIQLNKFEIERSTDGYTFSKLGQKSATGNISVSRTYSFVDINPIYSVCYYRLKLIDNNGQYRYSNTIVFKRTPASGVLISSISPNPFKSAITVSLFVENAPAITLQLFDLTGKMISTKNIQVKQGDNNIIFDGLDNLSEGIYLVRIITPSVSFQEKVLKGR